ncbi:sporulation peptidase YabG [Paenibacillus psychroresistens]|uniref:Sporulation peptidase YabG n=1 Tax=Paenibacillus psychroresistens TaxID=1778678 RepID=A0A6B8RE95_9BACL|nr:sporulation peptidase YabG [Paenibacillus psychroresistens]QGQ93676.1 sporulation peptidase YabG [Paenibacillus psychroresistens]
MRQGDLVVRKSYGGDVLFKIQELNSQNALLKGIEYRLLADSPIYDLSEVQADSYITDPAIGLKTSEAMRSISQYRKLREKEASGGYSYFEVPGKVLHLDGDPLYLRKSLLLYSQLRVPAEGFYVSESNMADALTQLLPQKKPDILVITGHDGLVKDGSSSDLHNLESYKNSHHFVKAVQVAREYERNRDSLVIIAGACQSFYEALLQAGANFASSPARVLIHALDPLYIAAKVSFTSIKDTVQMKDIVQHTMSGLEGLGGMETRGSHRIGIPGLNFISR